MLVRHEVNIRAIRHLAMDITETVVCSRLEVLRDVHSAQNFFGRLTPHDTTLAIFMHKDSLAVTIPPEVGRQLLDLSIAVGIAG